MVREESVQDMQAALARVISCEYWGQVKYIAVDKPSAALYLEFSGVFPSLKFLMLDTVHLAMAYERCFARHRSPGSVALRHVLRKFTAAPRPCTTATWGTEPVYEGAGASPFTPEEVFTSVHALLGFKMSVELQIASVPPLFLLAYQFSNLHPSCLHLCGSVKWEVSARGVILNSNSSLSQAKASDFLESMDMNTPFASRAEYIHAMASLAVVYRHEMGRTGSLRMPLQQLLHNATTKSKCGWLFNNLIHRASVSTTRLSLMPTGTTANEALHNELAQSLRSTIRP